MSSLDAYTSWKRLKRHHVQLKQIAAREINAGEIHQREVIEKFLVR